MLHLSFFHRTFGNKGINDKERESTQSHWGVGVIPKTVHKDRMEQNFDIWDFSLTRDKLEKIDALDMGHSNIVDHKTSSLSRCFTVSRFMYREKCCNFLMQICACASLSKYCETDHLYRLFFSRIFAAKILEFRIRVIFALSDAQNARRCLGF